MEALELAENGNLPTLIWCPHLGLRLGQPYAADLRLAVGAGRNPVAAHRPSSLPATLAATTMPAIAAT